MHLKELSGNTPTSVGKTALLGLCRSVLEKHPHERGEDLLMLPCCFSLIGNTPTSVGKTDCLLYCTASGNETPPRAWGRLLVDKKTLSGSRNTPTSVGKTVYLNVLGWGGKKHPHERGED